MVKRIALQTFTKMAYPFQECEDLLGIERHRDHSLKMQENLHE